MKYTKEEVEQYLKDHGLPHSEEHTKKIMDQENLLHSLKNEFRAEVEKAQDAFIEKAKDHGIPFEAFINVLTDTTLAISRATASAALTKNAKTIAMLNNVVDSLRSTKQ